MTYFEVVAVTYLVSSTRQTHIGHFLLQALRCLQYLFRSGPHPVVFGQVDPTNRTTGIDQELGWSGDVASVLTCSFMDQIILPNHLGVWIRKQREGVACL